MYAVYLRESDNTWTPFHDAKSQVEAVAWADRKGIDYQVEHIFRGGSQLVAIRKFGKHVQRRNKK